MKSATRQLITLTENQFMLNEAVLTIQSFQPQSQFEKNDIAHVRSILIKLRDAQTEPINEAIKAVENK